MLEHKSYSSGAGLRLLSNGVYASPTKIFAVSGQPALLLSNNGIQLVGVQRELKEMVQGWDAKNLREFCAEKRMKWPFITPAVLHQNGCAKCLIKSCKRALKKAIGDQKLTAFELYTCLLEAANLVNQRSIGPVASPLIMEHKIDRMTFYLDERRHNYRKGLSEKRRT